MSARNGTGRLFVFGWDGADWAVIKEGWRRGRLPVLKRLVERGQSGTLMSTIPPVTPCAWTSFLTGRDPGEHGIFGFRSVDPSSYRLSPVPGGARLVPTLIRGLDSLGYRTGMVTVPWTYPAEPLSKGIVVPGWDAPSEGLDYCHPPEFREALRRSVPRIPHRGPPKSTGRRYLEHQATNVALRERISRCVMEQVDPQVFMLVFTETDQASHCMWTRPPVPDELIESYDQVDAAMGRLVDEYVGGDDTVLVLSDHGSRPLRAFVHMAHLLVSGGWLRVESSGSVNMRVARGLKDRVWYSLPPALRLRILRHVPTRTARGMSRSLRQVQMDWLGTKAFPLGNEAAGIGIHLNVSPPFAKGALRSEDYDRTLEDLALFLGEARDPDTGEQLFTRIARREEIYHGRAVHLAPDLVLVPAAGYGTRSGLDLTRSVSRVAVGGHRREGIFATNRDIGLGNVAQIEDLLPKALTSAGYPIEEADVNDDRAGSKSYANNEMYEIESRLRDLGYIE